jgi:hypothetical protein
MGQGHAVKRGLIIGLAIAAAGVSFSYVGARSLKSEPAYYRGEPAVYVAGRSLRDESARTAVRPASEIVATVREMGLAPNSEVLRRGPYYVLHALDTDGVELRVVADAHFGDILSVRPAQPYSLAPDYVRAPRIIHVPQPGDESSKIDGDSKDMPRQPVPPTDALLTPIRPMPNLGGKPAPAGKLGPGGDTPPKAAPNGG